MWGRRHRTAFFMIVGMVAFAGLSVPGWAGDVFGNDLARSFRRPSAVQILSSDDLNRLPPEISSAGLLTQTQFIMQSYQGPIDDRTIIVGDAMAGQSISIGDRDRGFHFGGGFHGSIEHLRFADDQNPFTGHGETERFYLGVGAIGGARYYVSDSVAVFLQLHGVYGLLGLPARNALRIEGGLQF